MSDELVRLESGLAALEAQRALLGDAVVDAAIGGLRAKIDALRAAASPARPGQTLKQVSILFLDVVGSTTLSQQLDPEEISGVMDGALARGTAIVEAHRGRVLQYAGDNLLAAFGADEAKEDDAERAVRCGLALLVLGRTLADEVRLAHGHAGFDVRVGIHTGGVLLGGGVDEGDSIRGIAVNIAARMEQTAPPGALRISHDTYVQVRGVFDVAQQEPLAIKGVDAPVVSYLVLRAKQRAFRVETRGIEGVATRMVGRDAELEALQDAFKRLVTAGAALERVVVVADAGVGKSRLLYEFRNWAEARPERFFVFQARATPQTQGQPYGMLRDLLTWRLQIGDGDSMDVARQKLEADVVRLFVADEGEHEAEAHAHLLGQLIGLDYGDSRHLRDIRDDGRQIRNRGFHAAAQVMRRLGAQAGLPIVVFLDDLHWADDASLDFFDYLAQVDRDVPMLLLGLTRPTLFERRAAAAQEIGESAYRRIDLHPLDRDHSRYLANELLKKLPEIPAALRELITGGADGNPFYMEELVKMLVDQGTIDTHEDDGGRWTLDGAKLLSLKVPPTLTGVLQARLDGLPHEERHALQLASVIGLHFWDAALAHVEPLAASQLPPLAKRELVNASEAGDRSTDDIREYAFRHQILHQVIYDTVLKRIKREAHARTAQWLAEHSGVRAKGLLGTAAEHYERASDPVNAAEYYARAAEYTASTFDNQAALDYTARALLLASPDAHGLQWRLLSTRERTLDLLGRRSEQKEDIEQLLKLAEALDDDGKRAEVAWRRGDMAIRTADWATGIREAARAQRLAEQAGDEQLALRALQRLSVATGYGGDPDTGRAMAEAGLERAKSKGWLGLQSRLARAVTLCADVQGDRVARLQYCALDLACAREAGDRRGIAVALINIGEVTSDLGDYAQAKQHLEEALRANREFGNREAEGITLAVLSDLAWRQGEDAQALARAEAAVAIQTEVNSRYHLTNALWSLGNAELALGRFAQSTAAFERSEAASPAIGRSDVNALEGHARVALARGDDRAASAFASRLLAAAGLDPLQWAGGCHAAGADPFASAHRHLIRLTLHRVWSRIDDPRADAVLAEAHRSLRLEADAIGDAALRASYLKNIPEHAEIERRWQASATTLGA